MSAIVDDMATESVTAASADDRGRTVVAGHYEVELDQPLGAGGMALVYRGRDLRTRRTVALKTLRPEFRKDPGARARFRREARTLAFLHHPNVARVYTLHEEGDAPWAVLEYVPGRSLKDEIAANGPLDLDAAAHVVDQIASALDHLHRRGLVHLDVKPQNLIVGEDRTVKLIDFGLAQQPGAPQETIGGQAFGTAAYLAPEQAHGEPIGPATDIYALGCVVYEMLTGRPPFVPSRGGDGKDEIIQAHIEREPAAPSTVAPAGQASAIPPWLDQIVLGALAKDPDDRYENAPAFARAFRAGIEGELAAPVALGGRGRTNATTGQLPAAGQRPVLGSDFVRAAYVAGGRRLRQATGLKRALWRIVAALVVANLLLAAALLIDRGSLPHPWDGGSGGGGLSAGSSVTVTVDLLNVRAAAGLNAETITRVQAGDVLTITGPSESADGRVWWPVAFEQDGQEIAGYVAAENIERATSL